MKTMLAFGDSVLKGVLYENEHYRVTDASFYRRCEEALGIVIHNKAKLGSTIDKGEKIFERNLSASSEEYYHRFYSNIFLYYRSNKEYRQKACVVVSSSY